MIDCMDCMHCVPLGCGSYGCTMYGDDWFAERGKHKIKDCDDYEQAENQTNDILTAAWNCAEVTGVSCPTDCQYAKWRNCDCVGYLITDLARKLGKTRIK